MSKAKKGKEVVKGPGAGQRWDEQLIQEQLDTDNWRLCVAVVAGEDAGAEELVSALGRQMSAPSGDFKQRRRFYSLSLQEVLKKALESGTGAVSKSQASKGKGKGAASPGVTLGSKPPGAEALADLVKSQSGSEEGVGPDTLARAIKFCLLLLRQEDLVRRQQDAIREGRPGSGAVTPSKKKGGKQAKGAKGPGVEEGIPMPTKPESTMRKRGEEVGETSFVEDEPANGPEAYLLLSGVRSADVIAEMGRVGAAPSCLLRVQAGGRGDHGETEEDESERKSKLEASLRELWRGAERVLETGRDCGVRDTGVLLVDFREDPQQQERVQGLFDQVAARIYQLGDQKRQHKQYLDSLSLADITRAARRAKGDQLYREQLVAVPNQCCSVALLMESLLQQVCVSDVTPVLSVGDTGQEMSPAVQESLNIIKRKANIGDTKEAEPVPDKTLSYPVIYEGDRICERDSLLEHSGTGLAKKGVEKRMLDHFRVSHLLKRFPQLDQDERSRTDARYQQLQRLATQSHAPLPPSQLQSLLILLSFAEMMESRSPQLFDDPYPDRDRKDSIDRLTPVIANLQWSEPLSRDVISQRVQEALSPERGYPTCLTKYHKQSDKLLILLHPLLRESEWDARILTPTGFYLFQRFLHARISPLVERVYQLNSCDREKLLGAQDLTPTHSQVSLTQLSAVSGEKEREKGREGTGSSHSKAVARNSRTSRLKSSSRVSSPSVDRIRERDASSSREDLLTAQRSEIEQKLLLLPGYDVGDEWYAGRGSGTKAELSDREFLSAEKRSFYSSPLDSVTMQYSHQSGLSAGISLLIDSTISSAPSPRDSDNDVIKPATVPDPPASVVYASYRVRLPSGVRLSLSPYGKLGGLRLPKQMLEGSETRQREEEHDRTPSPLPPMTSESKLGGKARGKKTDDQLAVEQQRLLTEERERKKREVERVREERVLKFKRENKYKTLFASTEHGLQVTCSCKVDLLSDVTLRDGSDGSLRVTQCYPNAPSATQPCDKLRLYPASLEASRSYLEDGTVIRLMKDSSAQLLWPDGSSARSLSEGELELLDRDTPDLTALATHPQDSCLLSLISARETEFSLADKQWMYTDGQGQRHVYRWTAESENGDRAENESGRDGQELEASTDKLSLNKFGSFLYNEPLLKSWQTDPVSGEEMVTREDQVLAVFRKDGTRIMQFSDGTRITYSNTYPSIQVECPGYAKVRFSTPSSGQATITILEGNEITVDRRGTYSVSSDDVTSIFSQEGRLSLSLPGVSQVELSLSGRGDWISYKHLISGRVHAVNEQFETYECNTRGVGKESVELAPRMFVLSRDGSGLELLSREYAEQEIARWREREGVLLQSHALPGDSNVIIHSAVSPIATPSHESSHLPYTETDIVPVHLRTQYYFPLDLNKYRSKSGVFGASVGRGLQIGSSGRIADIKRLVPRAFRRRELLEHRPIGRSAIDTFVSSLEGVNRWWDEIKREKELFSPLELRTDSVLEQAQDLFSLFSSHSQDNDVVIQEYRDTVLAPPPPEKVDAPAERRPDRVEADRTELENFQANLVGLRNRDIPGYFASESGHQFLLEERSAPPDMRRLTEELPVAMRRGAAPEVEEPPAAPEGKSGRLINPRLSELSQETGPITAAYASTTIILPEHSGSTVSLTRDRPGNPSPHVSASTDPSIATTEDSPAHSPSKQVQGGPAARPQKPNPLGAGSDTGTPIPEYLFYNVAGIPRTAPVRLPNSLKSLRPGDKECEQIDETKQQNTASLSMPLCKSLKQGISLLETEVDFGILKEGCTYSYTLQVKNTGTTSTRFKIKPPPPSTGLKASYTPHPIAAGMSASFRIEIYAMPVGVTGERGHGRVHHSLEIVSEVNSLLLPVTATVLTETTYEQGAHLTLAKGVSLLPAKATSATGSQRL